LAHRKQGKAFFFEKKKQKAFIPGCDESDSYQSRPVDAVTEESK
jgi:hypothetical protein